MPPLPTTAPATRATGGGTVAAAPGTRAGPVRHTRAPPPLPSPRSWMRGTRGPQQQPQPLSLPPASAHAIMMSDEQGRVGRITAKAEVSAPGDPLYGLSFTVTGLAVLKADWWHARGEPTLSRANLPRLVPSGAAPRLPGRGRLRDPRRNRLYRTGHALCEVGPPHGLGLAQWYAHFGGETIHSLRRPKRVRRE